MGVSKLMFVVIDHQSKDMLIPIKSGFKTAAQANKWCKKHLPKDEVKLWGVKPKKSFTRYVVHMR
jgi:hypothetical protein